MAYISPVTATAGTKLTAANWNASLRDNLNALVPTVQLAYTSYTPVLVQSGTVTKTVTRAAYQQFGKSVHFYALLAVTGTGTGANVVTISLPVTMLTAMNDANIHLGSGHIFDVSASTKYRGWVVPASTTTVKLLTAHSTTDGLLGTTDFTAALASGDTVSVSGWYEAA